MPRTAGACARAAALVLVALAVLPAGRAGAVGSVDPAARGLRDGRLYVAPAVAETLTAGTRARLSRRLAQRRESIFIALVAFAPGDAFDGDGPRFLAALAGRLGRPGAYVTYDARGILWTRGHRTPTADDEHIDLAAHTVNLEDRFEGPPGPRLTHFLDALDDPDLAARERRAVAAFNKRVGAGRAPAPATTPVADDDDGLAGAMLALVGAVALLLGAGVVLLVRRRGGARHVADRPLLPGRVFSLAREASRDELAERADAMLIALSGLIDAAPPSEDVQRALDSYEAAERVLRAGDPDLPDLVGALVCIDLGRRAVGSERHEPPPCTYDPRHGPAQGRAVTVDNTKLRLCRACRSDVRAGRPADVLRDGGGRPYLDADSPWAASGYGAWSDPVRAVLDARHDPLDT